MRSEAEVLTELRRQLKVVRRRIDDTLGRLSDARRHITADGLERAGPEAWAEGKGDVFQLCVRLEVALAESHESADRLTRRLSELAGAPPPMRFAHRRFYPDAFGESRGARN